MPIHTPLCDVLGIDVPILAAPFGPWDSVELAAAVCEAGGLGSLGTAVRPLADLEAQWARLRDRNDRPFAINHTTRPFAPDVFRASLRAGATAISFHMGDPGDLVGRAHAAGALWIQQVMTAAQAETALERGADVLIAQGTEAGGHSGEVGGLVLVPEVAQLAGDVPVVAAGGIADGRGLAAALALGAQGVVMGTRLLASTEMAVDLEWKRLIVGAGDADTGKDEATDRLLPPYAHEHAIWRARPRVLRTARRYEGTPEQLIADVLGGGGHHAVPFTGQSAALVHDIRPAGQIVRAAVQEAGEILARLRTERVV